MKTDCEIIKINKKLFEDNLFIVKLGSYERPATGEEMDEFQRGLSSLLDVIGIEEPPILITHHLFSFETIDKEEVKKVLEVVSNEQEEK